MSKKHFYDDFQDSLAPFILFLIAIILCYAHILTIIFLHFDANELDGVETELVALSRKLNFINDILCRTGFDRNGFGDFLNECFILFSPCLNFLLVVSCGLGLFAPDLLSDYFQFSVTAFPIAAEVVFVVYFVLLIVIDGWKWIYILVFLILAVLAFAVGYFTGLLTSLAFLIGNLVQGLIGAVIGLYEMISGSIRKKKEKAKKKKLLAKELSALSAGHSDYAALKRTIPTDEASFRSSCALFLLIRSVDPASSFDTSKLSKTEANLRKIRTYEERVRSAAELARSIGEEGKAKKILRDYLIR